VRRNVSKMVEINTELNVGLIYPFIGYLLFVSINSNVAFLRGGICHRIKEEQNSE